MAESSLNLTYDELRNEVAMFCGHDISHSGSPADSQTYIDRIIESGLRQFLFPPPLEGESQSHVWSFLKPTDCIRVRPTIDGAVENVPTFSSPNSTVEGAPAADDFFTDGTLTGKRLVFKHSCNEYVIASVTDADTIVLTGDASGETRGSGTAATVSAYDATGNDTTITATAGDTQFTADMVGQYLEFDSTNNSYLIESITSTTVAVVTGDASAESGDYTLCDSFEIYGGDYDLPDDFGGIEGPLRFQTTTPRPPIDVTSEARLMQLRQDSSLDQTGRPRLAAVRPRTSTVGTTSTRWELMLWPVPDAQYNLIYTKILLTSNLATGQYMLGGAMHAETIRLACLAEADDSIHQVVSRQGYRQRFLQQLRASVTLDRQAINGEALGYNGDNSDSIRYRNRRDGDWNTLVNGVLRNSS